MNNHVIDPTFFYDALAEFSFDYELYYVDSQHVDEAGYTIKTWSRQIIEGSLQTRGNSKRRNKSGNIAESRYDFYCKSTYRIKVGDFIHYKEKWLKVLTINDFDEWGVRSCETQMVELAMYNDLSEFYRYISGEEIV